MIAGAMNLSDPGSHMTIGVTGAAGFIGRQVADLCRDHGCTVVGYSRSPGEGQRLLQPPALPDLSGLNALVHLSGENILGLWTKSKKERILRSRLDTTRALVQAIERSDIRPEVFVCASAVGIYGDTGDCEVDETSASGTGFLADVVTRWEVEALRAESLGVRVVCLRIGMVLGRGGGAMRWMLPAFRLGLGGRVGSGQQWMSCIHVHDVAGLILHAITTPEMKGPCNAVMPEPVTNLAFTRKLAASLHRPAVFPVPSLVLRCALGELSTVLLGSQRVLPRVALAHGYHYQHPTLVSALDEIQK